MQSCSLAPRSSRAAPGALCAAWQALQEFWPTVAYPPTGGWFATLLALSAWMLVVHPASGFVCPVITRFGSWHAMQLPIRSIAHQEVEVHRVDGLHVRVVAGCALNVALDQLHRSS